MDYDKERRELEKRLSEMTIEQKRSSLEAPFWNENAQYDKNTEFMKKVNKLWRKASKEREKRTTLVTKIKFIIINNYC